MVDALPTRLLVASLFGWLATGLGTSLLIPAWMEVAFGPARRSSSDSPPVSRLFGKLANIKCQSIVEPTTGVYFFLWLCGDGAHLAALMIERVGPQTWALYIIVAAAEVIILLTMTLKAHLWFWQKPLPKEDQVKPFAAAPAGFALSLPLAGPTPALLEEHKRQHSQLEQEASERKRSKRICGLSSMAWMTSTTVFCLLGAVLVWWSLSVKRFVDVGAPKASQWPHNQASTLAFALAVFGFFCWTGPRVYVLVMKHDDISTSSVVLGVGAHTCNMINIATVSFITFGTAAASSPFFLTSLFCIGLDIIRLQRKNKQVSSPLVAQLISQERDHRKKLERNQRDHGKQVRERKKRGIAPVSRGYNVDPSHQIDDGISEVRKQGDALLRKYEKLEREEEQGGNSPENLESQWAQVCELQKEFEIQAGQVGFDVHDHFGPGSDYKPYLELRKYLKDLKLKMEKAKKFILERRQERSLRDSRTSVSSFNTAQPPSTRSSSLGHSQRSRFPSDCSPSNSDFSSHNSSAEEEESSEDGRHLLAYARRPDSQGRKGGSRGGFRDYR
ncbi:hypothetical protein JCM5350_000350 [Sporobolomyces pararoseus]